MKTNLLGFLMIIVAITCAKAYHDEPESVNIIDSRFTNQWACFDNSKSIEFKYNLPKSKPNETHLAFATMYRWPFIENVVVANQNRVLAQYKYESAEWNINIDSINLENQNSTVSYQMKFCEMIGRQIMLFEFLESKFENSSQKYLNHNFLKNRFYSGYKIVESEPGNIKAELIYSTQTTTYPTIKPEKNSITSTSNQNKTTIALCAIGVLVVSTCIVVLICYVYQRYLSNKIKTITLHNTTNHDYSTFKDGKNSHKLVTHITVGL